MASHPEIQHKTSTPIRSGCKRFPNDIESSPIFSSDCKIKKTDIVDNDVCNFNFDDDMFSQEIFTSNRNNIGLENSIQKDYKSKRSCAVLNSAEMNGSPSCQSLLSTDDSLLKSLDLNSAISSNLNFVTSFNHIDSNLKSLNCSTGMPPDNIDDDDHAWDMSINVEIQHENCDKLKCNVSQENNCSIKWEDDSLVNNVEMPVDDNQLDSGNKDDVSFGNKIKSILLNNAQKPALKISQKDNCNTYTPDSQCSLTSSFFGLPPLVSTLIKKYKGITQLYDWQEECLKLEAIGIRKNLVYALPTSGGKTLVAEILILNEILCRKKNVIFVMPYVSIVQEKVRSLSPFAVELGFLIEEYAGAKGQYPPQKRRRKHTVFIATIEKALGLIHSYLETNRISELGLVVIDELHLIGESRRGATLESMLSKLMFSSEAQHIHIVGMSATIGNINEVAEFLKADVYTHDFRPVELNEYVKVEEEIYSVKPMEDPPFVYYSKTSYPYSPELRKQDPDEIGGLVREVSPHESCLVFCPSKKNCENVALLICQILDRSLLKYKVEEKKALYKALETEGGGTVCNILCKTLPYGVAYHNSGLTTAERKLLEEAFCAKTVFCICCTSTLAAGVNLPAKRVILRSPYIGREFINLSRYKQMVGRAGRAGLSGGAGESYLICRASDYDKNTPAEFKCKKL